MRGDALRKTRLENLRLLRGQLTLEEIARRSGTNSTYLSQIVNEVMRQGGRRPRALSDAYAAKIEDGLNLPQGAMDAPNLGRCAAETDVEYVAQTPHTSANIQPGPDVRGYVPIINWVQAGSWVDVEDPDVAESDWLPCPSSHGPHSYALRVEGDSMTSSYGKSYPDGCIIFVDPDQRGGVASGERVIAKLNGDNKVTFKVFVQDAGRRFLKPLNPQYPMIEEPFCILGKVIGNWEPE
jgi:SOS-response transcriptional repressor LexA